MWDTRAAVAAGTDMSIGNGLKSHTGAVAIPWGREGTEQLTH